MAAQVPVPRLQSQPTHTKTATLLSQVGGKWLRWWMIAAAAVSQIGQFEAEMSSDSFQLQASAALCRGVHCVRPAIFVGLSVGSAFALNFGGNPHRLSCVQHTCAGCTGSGSMQWGKDLLPHLCCNYCAGRCAATHGGQQAELPLCRPPCRSC